MPPINEDDITNAIDQVRKSIAARFAQNMGAYNAVALNSLNSAIANFAQVVGTPSSVEATQNFVLVAIKSAGEEGFKLLNKELAGSAAPYIGALFSMGKALIAEADRASAAVKVREVSSWIVGLRSAVNNAYANSGSDASLVRIINQLYESFETEEEAQELTDLLSFGEAWADKNGPTPPSVPSVEAFECGIYQGWVASHFTAIGQIDDDIQGFLDIRFESGQLVKASVVAPLGDRIADGLNRTMSAAGYTNLMELPVVKRCCVWGENAIGAETWICGWFDDRNQLINEPNSEVVSAFLRDESWYGLVTSCFE